MESGKPMEFEVGDRVMLKVSPWKGVVRFREPAAPLLGGGFYKPNAPFLGHGGCGRDGGVVVETAVMMLVVSRVAGDGDGDGDIDGAVGGG
ncbi:hypothetical protein Tco_0782956 [Tanacetum coccineum]